MQKQQWTDAEREALSKRGIDYYEQHLKSILEPAHDREYVAIHVDTGDYALGTTSGNATRALRATHPDGFAVIMKIGNEPEWGRAARLFVGQLAGWEQK